MSLRPWLAVLVCTLFVTLVGCPGDLEFGSRCERTSQCPEPFACVLGRCRSECVEQRDCPLASECVLVDGAGVCTLPQDACEDDSECPQPLVCGEERCRATCVDDDDCARGAQCDARDGRNVCVAGASVPPDGGDETPIDAGVDAGADGGTSRCSDPGDGTVRPGLDGWCIESSGLTDVDTRVGAIVWGDRHALEIDLRGAPAGSWVRAYQELALDESVSHTALVPELDVAGGAAIFALEALDASGAVIARRAYVHGATPGDDDACDATGRETTRCDHVDRYDDYLLATGTALGDMRTDVARVVRVRRMIELVAGEGSEARLLSSGFTDDVTPCPIAWWRNEPAIARAFFDRPGTRLDAQLAWGGDLTAAVHLSPRAACGSAIVFEGARWLERSAALPEDGGAATVELWWSAEQSYGGSLPHALLWQADGDLGVMIQGRRLRVTAGACGGDPSTPALEVIDEAHPIVDFDVRPQEIEVLVDHRTPRLCLAREGVRIGCDDTPACEMPARGRGALRIAAGAPGVHQPFRGTLDELRVRAGDVSPDPARGRTGACYVDRVCATGSARWVRDSGSLECRPPTDCTTVSTCPAHARDGSAECTGGGADLECVISPDCFTLTGTCEQDCVSSDLCRESIAIVRACGT
ncbi:hypothetical protein [Sandaracinus amylolyticus]|uniref:Uncharacterized protein n=1 Tax=Sandaracinus amylolyticus TaxID=927083 RepID=A0A0F6WAR7_9BACT|nr:hypothetical protein [Sandaracinus amylolyticus]AKF11761.1 hypothetical protein DB32_008910 [Sandaracinus amylolyticus]